MDSKVGAKNTGPIWVSLYKELRSDILSRRLKDGTKLSEAYVCRKYNVSRTPVREALFQLEAEGLISFIPNRGAFVTGLSVRDISDIFDMRAMFEIQAAEWAITRMDPDVSERLEEIVNLMEFYTLRSDTDRIMQFDDEFHSVISEGAENRMLQNAVSSYRAYLKNSLQTPEYSENQLMEIVDEHRAIYLAIETGSIKAARSAMETHMKNSKARRTVYLLSE